MIKKRILVVAPHPDDELLGVGGTLLRHCAGGDEVVWLILTNIEGDARFSNDVIRKRSQDIKKVAEMIGFYQTIQFDYHPTILDRVPFGELVSKISKIVSELAPSTIYMPNRSDIHSDHRIAFDATVAASKPFRYPFVKTMLMYETLSETDFAPSLPENAFLPNVFIDISNHFEKKMQTMETYESELGAHPFPRSRETIKSLALLRGAVAGVQYAEAFMLVREIR